MNANLAQCHYGESRNDKNFKKIAGFEEE